MAGRQRIDRVRREYNQWAANETLEDFALRFTAKRARRWSAAKVGHTALGAVAFLALEAIGGSITLDFGFANAVAAIAVVAVVIFATALPICVYAAKSGVDIDLLTRGAGFGYIGSTITSLIYASFTFIFFAIESVILAMALNLCLGIPQAVGYFISAVLVIPMVTYGIAAISRFQVWTQPLFIALNVVPIVVIMIRNPHAIADWQTFQGSRVAGSGLELISFGAAASVTIALIVQVGEQVDFLRFLPDRRARPKMWWLALLSSGPGWIVPGSLKLLAGSFLTVFVLKQGLPREFAADPPRMYKAAFANLVGPGPFALALTCVFVVVCQLKINVTNAYAGSIAWSNFFSRLTHSHPGRVVWLVFNVVVAILVMELGVYRALEQTLAFYSSVAVAWVGALVADLVINKPLGLSPAGIEFKRAHLYDVNPVGVGSMLIATTVATIAQLGAFGPTPKALAPFIALATALICAPLIAIVTRGRYYLAREPAKPVGAGASTCCICENVFEGEDMAHCPAYEGPICSLCCSLDARCHDLCKPHGRLNDQLAAGLARFLPARVHHLARPRVIGFSLTFGSLVVMVALILGVIGLQLFADHRVDPAIVTAALWKVFMFLLIVAGFASWWLHLNRLSRRSAEHEMQRQTQLLMQEIEAHERTDAALKKAKEAAEAANFAKSRYVVGLSHELRTPLSAIMGYAQLLERHGVLDDKPRGQISVIRRNANHLAGLIDGLLDVSKIEAGKLDLARDEVAILVILAQITDMFSLQAAAKGIGFSVDITPDLPATVAVDEKRLRQLLINLLSNAIKFTRVGEVCLKVTYRNQVADFLVSDTGPGIAPADRERIFQPFERLPAGRSEPGTGLGLTICRLLSGVMGGDLSVDGEVGVGSKFKLRLFLPRIDVALPRIASSHVRESSMGRGRTILVVDDDPTHRELMEATLAPAGFIVHGAKDALSGLDLADAVAPDLILLDIELPDGIDGWRVAERLRENGHVDARIVMLSASAIEEHRSAIALPFHDAFLMKPVDLDRLCDTIEGLLHLAERPDDPAPKSLLTIADLHPTALPDDSEVQRLIQLCEIGFIRGLREAFQALATDDERKRAFVDLMMTYVDSADLRGLMRQLERISEAAA